ncbi:MAG: pitrilysin family protein [Bacteroidota bacterium]
MKKYFSLLLLTICAAIVQAQNNFKLPAYQKLVLKNGLTVYLMEQKEIPMINVSVVFAAGAIYDDRQAGLANLTAKALLHGTKTMSKTAMENELDFMGASVNTFASKESAGLTAKFAAKDKDKVLDIIKNVLLNPVFDTTEFNKEKRKTLSGLEQAKESPRSVIGDYFSQAIYGNHPYANPTGGRVATVTMLTAVDAKKFYQTHYMPNGAAIAIAGDFNSNEMKTRLATLFNGWQKGTPVVNPAAKQITTPSNAQVVLVNKDDARETTFYIGGPGISRSNPDFVAIQVVNTVLGGRFTSMLNDELRVNTGLTYGANSSFTPLKNGGSFQISTFTATKNTEAAIDKALEVFDALHKKGLDDKTLTSARNYVKGQFPPRYETAGQLADLLTTMFWYGFDENFINNFEKNVDELTTAKAKEIIAKYFPKENLQFIMVGKAADIRQIAAKYGKVTELQIKEDNLKTF